MKDHLRSFLAHLRLNRNASAHTVRAYESDLDQFTTFLAADLKRPRPELQPTDITRPTIRGFLADLFRRGESRASAARKLAAVRTFLRYLKREGLIEADPGLLVVTPKREQKIPRHLEIDEMVRLLETPDTSAPLGRRDRAILELLYASGLRLSELVSLDLEDVNLGSRMVRVMGKGRKERLVPFNRSAAEALRAWLPDREALLGQLAAGSRQPAAERERPRAGRRHGTRPVSSAPGSLAVRQPGPDGGRGAPVERYDPFLSAFSHHADHPAAQVHVLQVEAGQLAQPQPRCVEELEDRAVAPTERLTDVGRLDQLRHLVDLEVPRDLLLALGRRDEQAGVRLDVALAFEVAEGRADRRQRARRRRA